VGDRTALDDGEYGGIFVVRIENHSESDVNATDVTWLRKGFVLS
jgi:hypothetical protein